MYLFQASVLFIINSGKFCPYCPVFGLFCSDFTHFWRTFCRPLKKQWCTKTDKHKEWLQVWGIVLHIDNWRMEKNISFSCALFWYFFQPRAGGSLLRICRGLQVFLAILLAEDKVAVLLKYNVDVLLWYLQKVGEPDKPGDKKPLASPTVPNINIGEPKPCDTKTCLGSPKTIDLITGF